MFYAPPPSNTQDKTIGLTLANVFVSICMKRFVVPVQPEGDKKVKIILHLLDGSSKHVAYL